MKILQINKFHFKKGGSETYYFNLIELLKEKGHEVFSFSMKDEKNESTPDAKFFIENIDFDKKENAFAKIKKAKNFIYSEEAKTKLERLIKDKKPDVAHLHNISHQLTPSIIDVLNKYEIPIVQTLHDFQLICPNYQMFNKTGICEKCYRHRYYNCALNKCVKNNFAKSLLAALELAFYKSQKYETKIDKFIAPSLFLKNKFEDWDFKGDLEQLYYFIDLDSYKPSETIGDYALYLGRLSKEKGLDILISAFNGLPNIKLKIAGTGPEEKKLKDFSKDNIEFLGHQNHQTVRKLLADARFLVVPSVWYENNPLVMIEAMAMGKVIIASDIGGMKELINDKENGYLFPVKDPIAIKEIVTGLYNDEDEIKRVGQNARKTAEKLFDKENHYKKILSIYNKLIKNRKSE